MKSLSIILLLLLVTSSKQEIATYNFAFYNYYLYNDKTYTLDTHFASRLCHEGTWSVRNDSLFFQENCEQRRIIS